MTNTDYAGSFVYENNVLKQFSQPEGYVAYSAGIFSYIYQYKDHLGNIRLSYQDKDNNGAVNSSEIVQENNYYPFGLSHKGYNTAVNGIDNKYKYNGKEFQDDDLAGFKLNMYDYGARNYDPVLGRWMNIDPLAEKGRRWSPYNYAMDNPVYFIDPDGMWPGPGIGQWIQAYARGAWSAGGNMVKSALTGTYSGIRNGVNATQKVASAYKTVGVSGAAKQYAQSVYETSGAKNAVETVQKAANGDPGAIGATVVNVAAIVIAHKAGKGGGATGESSASANSTSASVATEESEVAATAKATPDFIVTEQGVAIPQVEGKYNIGADLIENPHNPPGTSSYGTIENGKFNESLRIDPATPAGKKGPNYSHYHKNGKGKHYSPNGKDKDPGF